MSDWPIRFDQSLAHHSDQRVPGASELLAPAPKTPGGRTVPRTGPGPRKMLIPYEKSKGTKFCWELGPSPVLRQGGVLWRVRAF